MGSSDDGEIRFPGVRMPPKAVVEDTFITEHRVFEGGCVSEFGAAMVLCHPQFNKGVDVDLEACVRATAALRQCFAGKPAWFGPEYVHRLDKGLDQDLNPSAEQVTTEAEQLFRWWTGMRRS